MSTEESEEGKALEDRNSDQPMTIMASASFDDIEQVNCGNDSDSSNDDNYDHNRDRGANSQNITSNKRQFSLDDTEGLCQYTEGEDNELRNPSMVASCASNLDEFNHDSAETGANFLSLGQSKPVGRHNVVEEEEQQSSPYIGRGKVASNSDTNNNYLDAQIDSSNYKYGNTEEGDTSSSPSGIADIHVSGTAPAITATLNDNQIECDIIVNHGTNNVRRRHLSARAHGREEKSDRIDLIDSSAATMAPEEPNLNVQQRHKKQKLEIIQADGSKLAASQSNNSRSASAYLCQFSRGDFDAVSESSPTTINKSSQSDIFKCNSIEGTSNDDSTYNKSVPYISNIFKLSHFQRIYSNETSDFKQATEIKLHDRKKSRDVVAGESEDTSSVTDVDDMSEMTANNSKTGYRTFKGSMQHHTRRKRNQSRESQRRLSQASGYSKLDHHHYQTEHKHSLLQELKRIALLLIIVLISCFLLWKVYELLLENYIFLGVVKTPSLLGVYTNYAVSTDAKPCAEIGSDLLAKGGSAVDAAIGTLLCMGVILPNSLGLGGGCLMTIWDAKKKEAVVIDGREVAPGYADENMFNNDSLKASRGPLSIGVPGELAAYWKAHQLYGKLEWSHLFNGSIKFAEEGYPMVEHLASALRNHAHAQYISPQLAGLFTNPEGGGYHKEGDLFIQPALGATLKRIRDNGIDELYGGQTGQNFIRDLRNQGGKMTLEDLKKYEALIRPSLRVKLADDLILHTQPPPGSGIVLSIILRVMHKLGYYKNLKPQESFEAASLYYHRLAEAFKFAYGQRAGLEDKPDDTERMKQLMDKLLSDEYIANITSRVDSTTHDNNYYGGLEYFRDDHGTAHVSVLDAQGNAAAVSTSVNLYFGAGIYSQSTGIIYNDVMDDFVSPNLVNKFGLAPSKFNRIRPGKRPLSSMVPSVFTDSEGNVRLVVGGAGGTMITTGVAMVSLRNCFLGDDIKTSIDAPRIHHQFLPNKLLYEVNFPKDIIRALHEVRNHTVEPIRSRSSIIMAIASERTSANKTRITANSDYRKGGSVHGQ